MKKLTLLSFMVMLSLTALCSDFDRPQKEQANSAVSQKSAVELEINSQKADSENVLIENCVQAIVSVKNTEKDTNVGQAKLGSTKIDGEEQCGSYTEGISRVDFIEFKPDLRWWLT